MSKAECEKIIKKGNGYVLSVSELKIFTKYCLNTECSKCELKKKYGKCVIAIKLSKGGFFVNV